MARIDAVLAQAQATGLERLDAQVLLAHVLGRDRTWLRTHGDDALSDGLLLERFELLCKRRRQGTPVAYLTGEREFYGLLLRITPAVLDPRPDTEVLVDWALELLKGHVSAQDPAVVADLGTGSGAIALAVARHAPGALVLGVDRSAEALALAADNGRSLGLAVEWRLGSWLKPLLGERGHLLLSNPPYIAEGDPHLAALQAEPRGALVAGQDGLADLLHLIEHAPDWLWPGGWLLLEHGYDQAAQVAARMRQLGYSGIQHRRDLAGHLRCTGGQWPGPP
jgi:release factor glutamine methyltransferase